MYEVYNLAHQILIDALRNGDDSLILVATEYENECFQDWIESFYAA